MYIRLCCVNAVSGICLVVTQVSISSECQSLKANKCGGDYMGKLSYVCNMTDAQNLHCITLHREDTNFSLHLEMFMNGQYISLFDFSPHSGIRNQTQQPQHHSSFVQYGTVIFDATEKTFYVFLTVNFLCTVRK
jgi:hypothetical protein